MTVRLQGYFTEYENFRAKLMFLDDYDLTSLSFTKSYLMNKLEKIRGKSPIVENNKYFMINCGKVCVGYMADTIVPIEKLKQHKVECIVNFKKYNFKKNNNQIEGWNLQLVKISMIEY